MAAEDAEVAAAPVSAEVAEDAGAEDARAEDAEVAAAPVPAEVAEDAGAEGAGAEGAADDRRAPRLTRV